jgi:cobalt-zinc-cadmium efflux system protein
MFYKHAADINLKGALLLISNDALGSVGVITSSLIIKFTHLYFVDPLAGIVIGLLIAHPTYVLLRDSVHILMEGNPAKINPDDVENFIHSNFRDIGSVKDLHIWGLSPEKVIMAVRIRTNGVTYHRDGMKMMKQRLQKEYGFSDVYLELYEQKHSDESVEVSTQESDKSGILT